MKRDFLKVIKDTFIYGLGRSSEDLSKFLLLPLYTRFLTPTDYAIVSLISLFTGFAGIILSLGMNSSIFRFYSEKDDIQQRGKVFYGGLLVVCCWCLIIFLIIYPFKNIVSIFLFDTDAYSKHIMIGLGSTMLITIYNIPMFILRAERKSVLFVTNNIIKMLINILLGVVFIVFLKRESLGVLEATFFTSIIFTIYTIYYRLRSSQFGVDKSLIINLLKFGFPLVFAGFGMIILNSSDKYFLKELTTLKQVGIYSVGYTLGTGINILINSFKNAWPKFLFSFKDKKNSGKFFGSVFTYYIAIMGVSWLCIALFSKEVVMLMTPEDFWEAYKIIPIITLSYIFYGAAAITSAGIYTKDKTYNDYMITPFACVICLLLNYIFISKWGMIGAAWATLLSFLILFCLYTIIGNKYVQLIFDRKKILFVILLILLGYGLSLIQILDEFWFTIIHKILIILSTIMILMKTKIFFYEEYKFLKEQKLKNLIY